MGPSPGLPAALRLACMHRQRVLTHAVPPLLRWAWPGRAATQRRARTGTRNQSASAASVASPGTRLGLVGHSTLYSTCKRAISGAVTAASAGRHLTARVTERVDCGALTWGTTDRPSTPDTSCHCCQVPRPPAWALLPAAAAVAGMRPVRRARLMPTATDTPASTARNTARGMQDASATCAPGGGQPWGPAQEASQHWSQAHGGAERGACLPAAARPSCWRCPPAAPARRCVRRCWRSGCT